jgi:septal ring factor EnvC (AmiA/AmiB activator)
MSVEGTVVPAPGPADDPQGLQEEIERTRERLGQTVEALVAKVDVKARAQDEASRLIGRLKGRAIQARQQAAAQAYQARHQVADKTGGPRQQAADVAAGIAAATPDPVKQAAGTVAATAGKHRKPVLAGVGAIAAALLGWLLINRWRRRG